MGAAMTVYAVFLNRPDEAAWKTLQEKWPGRHFILTEHMAFVAPEGLSLTTDVTQALGIGDEAERLGIVFEWAAHNGYNRSDLWEWLRKVQA